MSTQPSTQPPSTQLAGSTKVRTAPGAASARFLSSLDDRRIPRFGGFSAALLRLELLRKLRNRRTLIFTMIMPAVFYLIFGLTNKDEMLGSTNAALYISVSLATYGAMIATTTGGAQVAIERALGWSRQLALTPLRPAAYILIKVIVSMVLGAVSVIVVFVLTATTGVHAPLTTLVSSGLLVILTSCVFAAFGVMLGYLLPAENAIQVASMVLGILSLIGGLFVPLEIWPDTLQTIARFTPAYGVGEIARAPLGGGYDHWAIVSVLVWLAIFVAGSALALRRDTSRV
ncbi:ABC transporter permease [Brevibacterium sp. S111]|uniref:ABC transporter permease n=1 Tax=Brevibacterium sp. S111 TaxID=2483795 RepID=UPI001080658F|nr:ABC transporter permease [Brevibacterium sp. S111]TGD13100.1 ABC transporter permease [Brevibacterium sp. S111]